MNKILFFCSPIGLGHAARDYAIAQRLDNCEIKFVTGSGAASFLKEGGFDVDDVYNPPRFNYEKGKLKNPLKWLWSYYKYYNRCKKISSKIIKKEDPVVVVSDEDFASLSVSQQNYIPNVLITDILETEFTSGVASLIEKKMNKAMDDIIKKCHTVILPEDGKNEENIRRVGPIVRRTRYSREQLRDRFGFSKKTLLVSVGGTDAGIHLIEKTLDVARKFDDMDFVVVSGPSIETKFSNVRNLGYVNNLHELIYAADLVVSLAGKSTIDECNSYGTPGIFIPIKNHFEQEDNALDEGYSYEDINRLDELIKSKLSQERNPLFYNGDKKAASLISSFLSD